MVSRAAAPLSVTLSAERSSPAMPDPTPPPPLPSPEPPAAHQPGAFHLGCAVWGHPGWVGPVFPAGTAQRRHLEEYVARFAAVEGNSVFHGLPLSATGYLLAGDYIQLGAGSTARLYKTLTQTNSNGAGQATLDLWPDILTAPADDETVVVANTAHLWRLTSTVTPWLAQNANVLGIEFEAAGIVA